MTDDTPQPGTPAFLNEDSVTPQPVSNDGPIIKSTNPSNSEVERLQAQLSNDPSDYKSWIRLIKIKQQEKATLEEEINSVYDNCLKIFEDDDEIWIKYAEYHLSKEDHRNKVEEIFKSCINMKSLRLWVFYLNKFVIKYNNLISGGRQALGNIIKAHEFALVDVGIDLDADLLYDNELTIVENFNAINEDQNLEKRRIKLQILRKAIKAPTKKIQNYWNQYIEACPKSEIQQNSADYLKVKTFVSQLSNAITGLDRSFNQVDKKLDDQIVKQLQIYQKWISFEKENRLGLPLDLLSKRIEYVYIIALRCLRFVPELWIEYSQYRATLPQTSVNVSKGNQVIQILRKAVAANPFSFSGSFTIAEAYELEGEVEQAGKVYETLISSLLKQYEINALEVKNLTEIHQEELKKEEAALKARRQKEMEEKNFDQDEDADANYNPEVDSDVDVTDAGSNLRLLLSQVSGSKGNNEFRFALQLQKIESKNESLGIGISLAFCLYMRFAKRSLEFSETRKIFSRAKKFVGHSWHIYSTSANIEYNHGNSKVATKVFELAMKKSKFQKNIDFILDYLNFLFTVKDQTNAKALFETSVKNFDGNEQGLKKLYLEYIKLETLVQDDVRAIKTLENRFLKKFPNVKLIEVLEDRFADSDFDPIKEFDYYGGFEKYLRNSSSFAGGASSKKRKLVDSNDHLAYNLQDAMEEDYAEFSDDEDVGTGGSNEPFVQDEIYNLLRVLPKASYCQPSMFDEKTLVTFLRKLDS